MFKIFMIRKKKCSELKVLLLLIPDKSNKTRASFQEERAGSFHHSMSQPHTVPPSCTSSWQLFLLSFCKQDCRACAG